MFSLAVSIPYNSDTNTYDISEVTDTGDQVKTTILNCDVYTSRTMVAATVLRWPNVLKQCPEGRVKWRNVLNKCPKTVKTWADVESQCPEAVFEGKADHAEYRVLQQFNTLVKNLNKQDLLLFYVLASPCDTKCTNELNPSNILQLINQIRNWNNYAVVFSDVFKPRNGKSIPENDLRGSLERLGRYEGLLGSVGLNNIFRCKGSPVQCRSCSNNGEVAQYCFSDAPSPGGKRTNNIGGRG